MRIGDPSIGQIKTLIKKEVLKYDIKYVFYDYTYNRKDSTIKVNANIDDIINCNYLFYRNNGFTNKYYFFGKNKCGEKYERNWRNKKN